MSETGNEAPEGAAAEKRGRKGGKLLPLVAAFAGLAGGAVAGVSFLAPTVGSRLAAAAPAPGTESDDGHGGGGGGDHGEGGGDSGDALRLVDNLVVNPAHSEGTRFLLVSVALEPGTPAIGDAIVARDVEIRDAMLRVLGAKTVDQLVDIGQRGVIAEELKAAAEGILGEGTIHRIFIPQYVIQ